MPYRRELAGCAEFDDRILESVLQLRQQLFDRVPSACRGRQLLQAVRWLDERWSVRHSALIHERQLHHQIEPFFLLHRASWCLRLKKNALPEHGDFEVRIGGTR